MFSATVPSQRHGLVVHNSEMLEMVPLHIPQLLPNQILIKAACVALNPSDAKMVAAGYPHGSLAGLDFSGTVVAVGSGKHPPFIVIGARVCGVACGYNQADHSTGAFADYVVADAEFLLHVPDTMSFEQASTFPVGVLTAGMVLFQILKLGDKKPNEDRHVLVYGGSTASGVYMIQILKRFQFNPIAVCSPHNFQLVKEAGAVAAYDYRSEDCTESIRAFTKDKLQISIDCITTLESMRLCYGALRRSSQTDEQSHARYVSLDSFPIAGHTLRAVRPSWVFAMAAFGIPLDWGTPYKTEGQHRDRRFAAEWMREVEGLVEQGQIRPLRVRVIDGKLEDSVRKGLELLRRPGAVSGEKIVCRIVA